MKTLILKNKPAECDRCGEYRMCLVKFYQAKGVAEVQKLCANCLSISDETPEEQAEQYAIAKSK